MANVLIVHDDSVISRTAYLLEERKRKIKLYKQILAGNVPVEYRRVSLDYIEKELETERYLLSGLFDDIQEGLFNQEFRSVHDEYVKGERK